MELSWNYLCHRLFVAVGRRRPAASFTGNTVTFPVVRCRLASVFAGSLLKTARGTGPDPLPLPRAGRILRQRGKLVQPWGWSVARRRTESLGP